MTAVARREAPWRAVLACELISATRALRLQARVPGGTLRQAFDLADSALERPATGHRTAT